MFSSAKRLKRKSTLLNTIEYMLGDYAKATPVGMICRGRQAEGRSRFPYSPDSRANALSPCPNPTNTASWTRKKIKQLTGGEEISARALYQSATYKPQFTLWLSCNDLPLDVPFRFSAYQGD